MARVNKEFYEGFTEESFANLKDPLIIVVDMIEGFINTGALSDLRINDIVPEIKSYLQWNIPSVFVADTHKEDSREFISYPKHCLENDIESEVIKDFKPYMNKCIHKNSTNTFTSSGWQNFMKEELHKYKDIIICGCCSDICIMQFALCLNAYFNEMNLKDYRVIVPIDAIDTYHIDKLHDAYQTNEFSIANMMGNGISVVKTIK